MGGARSREHVQHKVNLVGYIKGGLAIEVVQWLRVLAPLPKDPGLSPRILVKYRILHNSIIPVLGDLTLSPERRGHQA